MSTTETELNLKHEKFIENIVSGMNRTQAAIAAGISNDKNYAGVAAHRLIRNDKIRERIKARIEESLSLSDEEIIGTLTSHLRGSMTEVAEPDGSIDIRKVEAKGLGHLIHSYEVKEVWEGKGDSKVPATITKVKLYDAQKAAGMLAKIRGMDNHTQRVEVTIDTDGLKSQLTVAVQNGLNAGMSLQETLKYLTIRGVEPDHLKLIDGGDLVFPEAIDITPEKPESDNGSSERNSNGNGHHE